MVISSYIIWWTDQRQDIHRNRRETEKDLSTIQVILTYLGVCALPTSLWIIISLLKLSTEEELDPVYLMLVSDCITVRGERSRITSNPEELR